MDDKKEFLKMLVEEGYSQEEIATKLSAVGICFNLSDGKFTIIEEPGKDEDIDTAKEQEDENLTILGCMCSVVENLTRKTPNKEVFNEQIYTTHEKEIAYICKMVGLRREEAVILSSIIENEGRHRFDKHNLADEMGISYIRLLSFGWALDKLVEKHLIVINKNGVINIRKKTIPTLAENKPYDIPIPTGLNTSGFLKELKEVVRSRTDNEISADEMMEEISYIVNDNPECRIVAESIKLGVEGKEQMRFSDRLIFWVLVFRYIYEDDDHVRWDDFDDILDDESDIGEYRNLYEEKLLDLQGKGIIEPCMENGMASPEYFHLTDEVKEKIFAEVGGVRKSGANHLKVVRPEDIQERELYYNETEGEQIRRLESLLKQENFRTTCDRLKRSGLRTGFSCLFYGGPGTGKSESVYQLAKRTGRAIVPINVNEIKSCWVGESEKMIAGVFSKYRQMVENSDVAPILLFNEADAIFGIRRSGATDAVDKMENAIQNLLLEGMEKLNDGILIATTNLTQNLDSAFERRFLYKIKFGKPGLEVKAKIWKYMIPDLSESEARELAEDYDFSGGQIENISRKKIIKSIIDGIDPTFKEVKSYCGEEHIHGNGGESKRIGF